MLQRRQHSTGPRDNDDDSSACDAFARQDVTRSAQDTQQGREDEATWRDSATFRPQRHSRRSQTRLTVDHDLVESGSTLKINEQPLPRSHRSAFCHLKPIDSSPANSPSPAVIAAPSWSNETRHNSYRPSRSNTIRRIHTSGTMQKESLHLDLSLRQHGKIVATG